MEQENRNQENMDYNNRNLQENADAQPTEQAQNPYMQPSGQTQNSYVQPSGQAQNAYTAQSQPASQPPVFSEDVSMGEWMWTILLLCIPIVNIILLIVWAFGGGTNPSKANYCKAQLLWMLIFCCLSIVLTIVGLFLSVSFVASQLPLQ